MIERDEKERERGGRGRERGRERERRVGEKRREGETGERVFTSGTVQETVRLSDELD